MPTTEYKNIHFICKLKMEAEIACAHTVKLTGPGLIIDKAGVVADELTYTFDAGEGLIEQDVGIEGPVAGDFKLYGDITSPYFISQGDLKVKKDEINIRILEDQVDGWYGELHGMRWDTGAPGTYWSDDDLYYVYNHPIGAGLVSIGISAGSGVPFAVRQTGPGGTVNYSSTSEFQNNITTAGKYIFKVYLDGRWVSSDALTTLGTRVFTFRKVFIPGTSVSKTVSIRGKIYKANNTTSVAYGVGFSQDFGELVYEYNSPPSIVFALTFWTNASQPWVNGYPNPPTPTGYTGGVSGGNGPLTATGTFTGAVSGALQTQSSATKPTGDTILILRTLTKV